MLSITKFFASKTIKLTDSFIASMYNAQKNDWQTIPNIISFSLPKIDFDEDVYYYGNKAQKFLIPKYDSIKEFSIEILENPNGSFLSMFGGIGNSAGAGYKEYVYSGTNEAFKIKLDIYDNNFNKIKMTHIFSDLRITKIDTYTHSYNDEAPCKLTVSFEFGSYEIIES